MRFPILTTLNALVQAPLLVWLNYALNDVTFLNMALPLAAGFSVGLVVHPLMRWIDEC